MSLLDFGFEIEIPLWYVACPNCKLYHKVNLDKAKIGTYVMCKNFSRRMSYKYPKGRAYIINFYATQSL